jgi:alpha-ketoglutarate-dependent taurine dioxygenase
MRTRWCFFRSNTSRRAFGELTPAHPVIPGIPGHPEVFEIDYTLAAQLLGTAHEDLAARYDASAWHTDVTFVERPPLGSILNAVVIPPNGGDTLFSDQQAAYEALSEPIRTLVDGLSAVHSGEQQFGPLLKKLGEGNDWEGEKYDVLRPVEHPVVRTHPDTGARILFVNPGFTSHIKGFSSRESDALLRFLYEHSTQPEFTVRYHWHAGDLGFWDNRQTQHSVVRDFGDQHRVIQRVTLRGDRPV